jgi:hypothetical protein
VTRLNRSSATGSIDNSPGGNLPPLVIRAFGAHDPEQTSRCFGLGAKIKKNARTVQGSQRLNTSRKFCILRSCSHAVRFIVPAPLRGTKPDNSLSYVTRTTHVLTTQACSRELAHQ